MEPVAVSAWSHVVHPSYARHDSSRGLLFGVFLLAIAPTQASIGVVFQMVLGNPSNATAEINNRDHCLIQRTVGALDCRDNLGDRVRS